MKNMHRYFLYLFCQLITHLKSAYQSLSQRYVNASSGLNRAVLVQEAVRLSYGYFTADKFSRLQVPAGLSTLVISYKECAINCLNVPACASFNVASFPDADGKFQCELLNNDKYNNLNQLISAQNYHHFSIKVCHLYYRNI